MEELERQLTEALATIEKQEKEIKKLKTMYSNTIEIKLNLHDRTKILEKQVKYLEREKEELLKQIEDLRK